MKKIFIMIVIIVAIIMTMMSGCYVEPSSSVDLEQQKETEKIMKEVSTQIGMPDITHFYEKKVLKELYELRDDSDLICYWYTKNTMTGKWVYEGQCIGYGIPYSTQFSNPEKFSDNNYDLGDSWGGVVMPQAEPNGLFVAEGMSATWVINIDPETGKLMPDYVEQEIRVSQNKIRRALCEDWSLPEGYDDYVAPVVVESEEDE